MADQHRSGAVETSGVASFFEWLTASPWANSFWVKMVLFALVGVHALAFRKAVYQNPKRLDAGLTPAARLAGIVSMILWAGLIVAGRLIGFDD